MAENKQNELEEILALQRNSFTAARPEALALRRDRVKRAIALLVDHQDDLAKAMSADFGNRSVPMSLLTDIMSTVNFRPPSTTWLLVTTMP